MTTAKEVYLHLNVQAAHLRNAVVG